MTLRLQAGIAPAQEAAELRECAARARQLMALIPGSDIGGLQQQYLNWVVMDAEGRLRHVFADPAVWQELHGEAYWQIRNLNRASARPAELIGMEAEHQACRLEELASGLAQLAARLDAVA